MYGLNSGDLHAGKVEITPRGTQFDLVMPRRSSTRLFSADWQGERVQHPRGGRRSLRARLQAGRDREGNRFTGPSAGTFRARRLPTAVYA